MGNAQGKFLSFTQILLLFSDIVIKYSYSYLLGKYSTQPIKIQKLHRSVRDLPNCPRTTNLPPKHKTKQNLLTYLGFYYVKGPRK